MPRKSIQTHGPLAERDARIAALAESLPSEPRALLDLALESVRLLHAAILSGDEASAQAATDTYDAVVWLRNGRGFFGCRDRSNPEAGGIVVERHCRAAPCAVPMWGQTGEFLVVASDIRAVVEVGEGFSALQVRLQFNAVDFDKPFISETGFRSHYDNAQAGRTVDAVARNAFVGLLQDKRTYLSPEYRSRLEPTLERWPWLRDLADEDRQSTAFEDACGQMAFRF